MPSSDVPTAVQSAARSLLVGLAMAYKRPHVEPAPALLQVRWADASPGLAWPSVAVRLDALDLTFRVAAGSFGTTQTRLHATAWPLPRPATASIRYGSPFDVAVIGDVQTFFLGTGVGTGVVGMLALLRLVWGVDLDLKARRATARAEIAEADARTSAASADRAEAELRTAKAHRELQALGLDTEQAAVPLAVALEDDVALNVHEATARDARAVTRMLRDQRHPRQLEALWPAMRRLMSVRHGPPSEVDVREVSAQEASRMNLFRWLSR